MDLRSEIGSVAALLIRIDLAGWAIARISGQVLPNDLQLHLFGWNLEMGEIITGSLFKKGDNLMKFLELFLFERLPHICHETAEGSDSEVPLFPVPDHVGAIIPEIGGTLDYLAVT
jgi:hypothetical protein